MRFDLNAVEKIAKEEDSWYKKLKAKEAKLLALPAPSKTLKIAAWRAVVKAYWNWLMIQTHEEEVKAALMQVRAAQRARVLEMKHKLTHVQISRLKNQLGNRFQLHLATSGGRPSKQVHGLPAPIARGLSVLQEVTSTLPPKPSAQPPPSSEPK